MTDESVPPDENKLIAERREKLNALRARGNAFPNDFRPDAFAGDLQAEFEGRDAAAIEAAQRDPRQFAAIYEANFDRVYAYVVRRVRDRALAQAAADLQKESTERRMVEEQVKTMADLSSRIEEHVESFDEARKALERTQEEMQAKVQASLDSLAESERKLQKEINERLRLTEALAAAERKLMEQAEHEQAQRARLASSLEFERIQRQRLEADVLRARHASMRSVRAGNSMVNSLRHELRQPVESIRTSVNRLLQGDLASSQKQEIEAVLENTLMLQMNLQDAASGSDLPEGAAELEAVTA